MCWHKETQITDIVLLNKALLRLLEDAPLIRQKDNHDLNYLPLAILFALRIREGKKDIDNQVCQSLSHALTRGELANIHFPKTMVANMQKDGSLSAYVERFLTRKDTLADRDLGAAISSV